MHKALEHFAMDSPVVPANEDHCVYWCNVCDCNQVDSRDYSTGRFFIVFGHMVRNLDNYEGFQLAICNDCLEN